MLAGGAVGCGHILTCLVLARYWQDIRTQFKVILELVLHVSPIPFSHYCKSVPPHLLNAAWWFIPVCWKSAQIPIREHWIHLVNNIMAVEEWMATCKGRHDKLYSIWATWIHYTSTFPRNYPPTASWPMDFVDDWLFKIQWIWSKDSFFIVYLKVFMLQCCFPFSTLLPLLPSPPYTFFLLWSCSHDLPCWIGYPWYCPLYYKYIQYGRALIDTQSVWIYLYYY